MSFLSPTQTSFASILSGSPSGQASAFKPMWVYVRRRFQSLVWNLKLTPDQVEDGETKHKGVVACLNRAYWSQPNETANRIIIGSWGKDTRVRPPRDIDVLFILPVEVYYRFEHRTGNRQSQLLQELREALRATYPATDTRGDGQVIVVPFNTYKIEVAPAFHREGGGFLICDTHDGGRYKHADPNAEFNRLDAADRLYNGNVRKLACILKQWQRTCNVPIQSFQLEALIPEVLATKRYGGADEFWFDWLVRDFFAHMITRANGQFSMPMTGEIIMLGDEWLSGAQSAYARALKACNYERDNYGRLAGEEWQKIFGAEIPLLQ